MRIIFHRQFNNAGFPNGPVNPVLLVILVKMEHIHKFWYGLLQKTILL